MGYFRIFYYVAYIFNTLTRIIKRHGKWLLWFLCIAIFLVVCMYNPKSQAVYIGDMTYTDPNNNIIMAYNNISLDLLRRYDVATDEDKAYLNNYLQGPGRCFYCYYGYPNGANGSGMLNGQTYQEFFMYILSYYPNPDTYTRTFSNYTNYLGNECKVSEYTFSQNYNIIMINFQGKVYDVTGNVVNIPDVLYGYYSDYVFDFIFNNYSLQEIELLHDMNNKLYQANQELQTQTDFLTDEPSSEDFDSSDLPTDSGVTDTTTTGVDNIFTTVYNVFTGDVEVSKRNLNITIPFTR